MPPSEKVRLESDVKARCSDFPLPLIPADEVVEQTTTFIPSVGDAGKVAVNAPLMNTIWSPVDKVVFELMLVTVVPPAAGASQDTADPLVVKYFPECPDCEGTRLRKESLYFKVNEKNI